MLLFRRPPKQWESCAKMLAFSHFMCKICYNSHLNRFYADKNGVGVNYNTVQTPTNAAGIRNSSAQDFAFTANYGLQAT